MAFSATIRPCRYKLPDTKVKTDSYVAVQLLEREDDLSTRSLQRMAEALDGTFTITILDARNNMHFVKGNNPLTVILLPDLGCYLYASTGEILRTALGALGMSDVRAMVIPVEQGEILHIDAHGQRTMSRFNDSKLYDYTRYMDYWPICGTDQLTAGDRAYLDELKAVASAYGYSPESIDRLVRHGFLPEEIEEFIYEGVCAI